jgi:hypothetical protein
VGKLVIVMRRKGRIGTCEGNVILLYMKLGLMICFPVACLAVFVGSLLSLE